MLGRQQLDNLHRFGTRPPVERIPRRIKGIVGRGVIEAEWRCAHRSGCAGIYREPFSMSVSSAQRGWVDDAAPRRAAAHPEPSGEPHMLVLGAGASRWDWPCPSAVPVPVLQQKAGLFRLLRAARLRTEIDPVRLATFAWGALAGAARTGKTPSPGCYDRQIFSAVVGARLA